MIQETEIVDRIELAHAIRQMIWEQHGEEAVGIYFSGPDETTLKVHGTHADLIIAIAEIAT